MVDFKQETRFDEIILLSVMFIWFGSVHSNISSLSFHIMGDKCWHSSNLPDSENHNREYTWKAFAACKFIQAVIIVMVATRSHLLTKYYKSESRVKT